MFSSSVFAGSAAAPNYTFSGNTNTGMFNPMANIVGFSTAGAERLRVDASGNVGIGTTNPGAMLEVAGQVKITGGTPGAGKVLTSDAAGLATWTTPSAGSVTSVATGTGLSGGPITSTGTISLANTTVAAGSFGTSTSIPTFNVDAQGRLTGVTAQAIPNATTTVTGLLTFGDWNIFNGKVNKAGDTMTGLLVLSADPSATLGAATKQYVDAAITTAGANYIRKDGTVAFTAAQSMGSFKINFVADPVSAQDAATKNYADTKILSKTAAIPAVGQNGQSLRWNDGNTTWEYYTASAALGYTPVNIIGDTMTGALIHPAGTAAAPSVGVGATTLGLFNGGTNILGISTAGTERMRIDASGNVGIGVASGISLFAKLHVENGAMVVRQINAGGTNYASFFLATEDSVAQSRLKTGLIASGNGAFGIADLNFVLNNATNNNSATVADTRMIIKADGSVGIGTTIPTAVLNLKAGTATANTAPLKFTSGVNLTTPEAGAVEYDGTNIYFTDSTAARRTIATATTLGSYLPLAGGVMTGAVVSSAGTAAAPSVGVGANTLGLFNGGTNILGFSTAGTERMRIDPAGKIGIGTTAPEEIQHIYTSNGSGLNYDLKLTGKSGNTVGDGTGLLFDIGHVSDSANRGKAAIGYALGSQTTWGRGDLYFMQNSVADASRATISNAVMTVTNAGNVGIGTTLPITNLHVYGPNSTSGIFKVESSTSGSLFIVGSSGSNLVEMVSAGGSVGIASGSPVGKLNVGSLAPSGIPVSIRGVSGQTGDLLRVDTGTGTTGAAFKITSAGNVGIGTTAPTAVLNLKAGTAAASTAPLKFTSGTVLTTPEAGAVEYDGNLYFTDAGAVRRTIATITNLGSYLPLAGGSMTGAVVSSAGTAAAPSVGVGSTSSGIFSAATDMIGLSTAGTERMRVDATGKVGIGTLSPTHTLDINGNLMTRANIYLGGTTSAYINNPSNEIIFGTNGSDRMRIESGGRTFIGGGSAAASKLDVNGNVTIGASYAAVNVAPTNGLIVEGNVGIGTTLPGAPLEVLKNAIAATNVNGLLLNNLTAATNGAGQGAPALTLKGQAWDTGAVASVPVEVKLSSPAMGQTANGNTFFKMSTITNGGGPVDFFTYDSYGNINLSLRTSSQNFIANNYLLAYGTYNAAGATYNDALQAFTRSTATSTATSQYAPRIKMSGSAWDTGTASAKSMDWMMETTANGGNPVTGNFNIGYSLAGAATTYPFSIANTGYVGIGNTAPAVALDVLVNTNSSNGPLRLRNSNAGTAAYNEVALFNDTGASGTTGLVFGLASSTQSSGGNRGYFWLRENSYFQLGTANTERMRVTSTGSVGIGTTNPGYKLDVQGGDINASGSVRAAGVALTSDIRFKKDIQTLDFSLEKILAIRGVEYNWRSAEFPERLFNDRHQIGVIAQEVEKVFPEVVDTNKDGFKSVNYPALIAPLIEAVKTLYHRIIGVEVHQATNDREIASVKAKAAQLESLNAQLKQENIAIKARLEKIEKALSKSSR